MQRIMLTDISILKQASRFHGLTTDGRGPESAVFQVAAPGQHASSAHFTEDARIHGADWLIT